MPAPQQYPSARRVSARTATRHLDGVPHDIVGLSALFSVLFAAVVLGMWLSGPTGRIAAVAICMVGVPMLVSNLRSRSERLRDDDHPAS
jgi:Flp pilus assembly protein TadB